MGRMGRMEFTEKLSVFILPILFLLSDSPSG
jgi:hypothetical protein